LSSLAWASLWALLSSLSAAQNCEKMQMASVNDAGLVALESYIFPRRPASEERENKITTEALAVYRGDCVLFERYERGFTANKKHLTWSVSKSVTSVIMGVAEHKGVLRRDDLLSMYYPELTHPHMSELKLGHLLHWSSGFEWQETYEFAPLYSDVVAMLYTEGRSNMADYVLQRPWPHRPGTRWNYSTGDSTLMMGVLGKALRHQDVSQCADENLFQVLGIQDVTWERDTSGTLVGGAYLYMTAKDLAKIGQLMLQEGLWKGKRLLSKDWVQESSTLSPFYTQEAYKERVAIGNDQNAGMHWYVNQSDPARGIERSWNDAPEDIFIGVGHWGQMLAVFPSQQLVVVRFADELDGTLQKNKFFGLIMEAFGKCSGESCS